MQLAQTSGKPIVQVARELGISDTSIHQWRKELADHGLQAFPGSGHQTEQEEEIRRLKRDLEVVKQERDILKKMPVFQIKTVLAKKCIPDGDYQQTKGVRSEQQITTGKIEGFRKFDRVRYRGQEYFIKGRMSTGYAILMGIDGGKVDFKPIPKFEKMKRVRARSSWMMQQRSMESSLSSPI